MKEKKGIKMHKILFSTIYLKVVNLCIYLSIVYLHTQISSLALTPFFQTNPRSSISTYISHSLSISLFLYIYKKLLSRLSITYCKIGTIPVTLWIGA